MPVGDVVGPLASFVSLAQLIIQTAAKIYKLYHEDQSLPGCIASLARYEAGAALFVCCLLCSFVPARPCSQCCKLMLKHKHASAPSRFRSASCLCASCIVVAAVPCSPSQGAADPCLAIACT
jgi:hypothetical protein